MDFQNNLIDNRNEVKENPSEMNETSFSQELAVETPPKCSKHNLADCYCSANELFNHSFHDPNEFCDEGENAEDYDRLNKRYDICDPSQDRYFWDEFIWNMSCQDNAQKSTKHDLISEEVQQKDQQLPNTITNNSRKTKDQTISQTPRHPEEVQQLSNTITSNSRKTEDQAIPQPPSHHDDTSRKRNQSSIQDDDYDSDEQFLVKARTFIMPKRRNIEMWIAEKSVE